MRAQSCPQETDMTEKLFYKDQYIKEFTALVVSCDKKEKGYEVILKKTAFYPEGGGQPGDRGTIGDATVADTYESAGKDEIIHLCDRPVSGEVMCRTDWPFRFSNMQQHSGEHIFSGFVHSLTGFDNVGFHMGKTEVTVDFSGPVSDETLLEAERLTNNIIFDNVSINALYPSREELPSYDFRSKKEIDGAVRLIEIPGADLCACCGTHVARTGEIGIVKVISSEKCRQGVRVTLKIGSLALEDYEMKNSAVLSSCAKLKAKHNELPGAVDALLERQNALRIKLSEANDEIFALRCRYEAVKTSKEGKTAGWVFDGAGDAENARKLADILSAQCDIAAAFSGSDDSGYKYALICKAGDARDYGRLINERLGGRGGGKPDFIMGTLTANRDDIAAFMAEI